MTPEDHECSQSTICTVSWDGASTFGTTVAKDTIRAVCEDDRVAATLDLWADRAEGAKWRKLHRPVLPFWGAKGTLGKPWDALASSRADSSERVSHKALACGDLLTEEAHDAMLAEFSASVRE